MTEFSVCSADFEWKIGKKKINLLGLIEFPLKVRQKSQIDWFKGQSAVWGEKFRPEFAEIWTIRGIGFVFNSMEGEDLLEYEE